jgi:hypothetical protein
MKKEKCYKVEVRGGKLPLKEWMKQNPEIADQMAEAFWQGLQEWRAGQLEPSKLPGA